MGRTCLVVVCGAPLARRAPAVARALVAAGWRLRVAVTPSAEAWVDAGQLEDAAGVAVRSSHRAPGDPKDRTPLDAVLVCPATFNTVNKLATGIADTYAAGALAEALGSGVPITVVPMVNEKLWGHPAWEGHLDLLQAAGVTFVDPTTGTSPASAVHSGTAEKATEAFDANAIAAHLGNAG